MVVMNIHRVQLVVFVLLVGSEGQTFGATHTHIQTHTWRLLVF